MRSHTALDILGLEGHVPETLMSGQTADISTIFEFEWFQWVMFYEPTETYPSKKWTVGRYVGSSIDVGTVMTQKILKSNGEFVSRNTVCAWTDEEEHNEALLQVSRQFMEELEGR